MSTQGDAAAQSALERAFRQGVPEMSAAIYARWWQFEAWLREVIYVEMSSYWGAEWSEVLDKRVEQLASKEQKMAYMATPDRHMRLTYMDFSLLLDLVDYHWDLVSYALPDKDVWAGRMGELKNIRNRMAHCRRPHRDDLARLEQLLRDLEPGAFESYASFNRQRTPSLERVDHQLHGWITYEAADMSHMRTHAENNKDILLRLTYSSRPWAKKQSMITGSEGYLIHVNWHLRSSSLNARRFWTDEFLPWQDDVVFSLLQPFGVELVFPASMDPERLAQGIEQGTVSTIHASRHFFPEELSDEFHDRWYEKYDDLDWRVQMRSGWTIVDDTTRPISIFAAD